MFVYPIICNLKIHCGPEWWFVSAYKMNLPYPPYFNWKSPLICHQFVTLESVNYWVILPLLLIILYQMVVSLVQYLCSVFLETGHEKVVRIPTINIPGDFCIPLKVSIVFLVFLLCFLLVVLIFVVYSHFLYVMHIVLGNHICWKNQHYFIGCVQILGYVYHGKATDSFFEIS